MWLRWMSGDAEAWVEPWQPATLDRCRDYINQTDALMATLGETLEVKFDATFEYLTPWAGRQHARMSEAVLHVLMHSSQYRGEASGFLNAEGHTVPDIDFMRYLTVPQDQ
jgi:hypothetical protein